MAKTRIKLEQVKLLKPFASHSFQVEHDGRQIDGFVVREQTKVYAYVNSCPHTGAPLNWTPDQFLTTTGRYIQCSIHGAQFKISDGECFSGPCAGQFLKPLSVEEVSGEFYLVK